jgi:hypothetical protein
MFISRGCNKGISEYKVKEAFELILVIAILGLYENICKMECLSVALSVFIVRLGLIDLHEVLGFRWRVPFSAREVFGPFLLGGKYTDYE